MLDVVVRSIAYFPRALRRVGLLARRRYTRRAILVVFLHNFVPTMYCVARRCAAPWIGLVYDVSHKLPEKTASALGALPGVSVVDHPAVPLPEGFRS